MESTQHRGDPCPLTIHTIDSDRPHGQRFLVNTALAAPDEAPLTLLVNWSALLPPE